MKIIKGHKAILAGLAFVVGMLFSGCGSSMPKCDDKEVLDLVTQLVKGTPAICWNQECKVEEFSYSTFIMNYADKEAKLIKCAAKVDKPKIYGGLAGDAQYVPYTARYTLDGQVMVVLDYGF